MYTDWEPCSNHECSECSTLKDDMSSMKYWLQGIVEQVYSREELDENDFENCLEELCALLGMKVPKLMMQISRKEIPSKTFSLNTWLDWNNQELKRIGGH